MTKSKIHHGTWPQYENYIVASENDLKKLRDAVDEAISTGKSDVDIGGGYKGIRCLDETELENTKKRILLEAKSWATIALVVMISIYLVSKLLEIFQ